MNSIRIPEPANMSSVERSAKAFNLTSLYQDKNTHIGASKETIGRIAREAVHMECALIYKQARQEKRNRF